MEIIKETKMTTVILTHEDVNMAIKCFIKSTYKDLENYNITPYIFDIDDDGLTVYCKRN